MKRIILALTLLATVFCVQAQSYYICNKDGSAVEIPVSENEDITFVPEQKLVQFNNKRNVCHSFATANTDSIVAALPLSSTLLDYSTDFDVVFNEADADNYYEKDEVIITDELIDESGDFHENFSYESTVIITFNESGVVYSPSTIDNVTITKEDNTHITINSSKGKMRYQIKGTCSNGSIKIYSTKKFMIQMNNLNLTNPNGPAINIQSGKTVYFSIGKNTTNSLCDGAVYASPSKEGEDQKGTLFSEGQLIFSGSGTLNVKSLGGHGICSDDYIRIREGNINITEAAKDGFNTNDLFRVGRTKNSSPKITVNANGNGVDCGKGYVLIEAGNLTFNTVGEAIKVQYEKSDTNITPNATINGGFIKICTTGEKASAIKTTGNFILNNGVIQAEVKGNGSKIVNSDGAVTINGGKISGIAEGSVYFIANSDTTAAGGIKSCGNVDIKGGNVAIKCTGKGSKAINSDANVTINNADVTLLSTGENYNADTDDKKSRAVTCITYTQTAGNARLLAYDKAISATSATLSDGTLHAISNDDTNATTVAVKQSAGWMMTKGKE
ncbi:MAG: carbohydrate-binding domain-containing protein [Bacteroidaceae bacterium]|nr:carbohydrate-binding domain-containing protein [Bacteroidaceae bacterium]